MNNTNRILFKRHIARSAALCLPRMCVRHKRKDLVVYDDPFKFKDVLKPDRIKPQRRFKKQAIENLFLGQFDPNLLEYPQLSSLDETEYMTTCSETIRRYVEMNNNLEIINNNSNGFKNSNYSGLKYRKEKVVLDFQNLRTLTSTKR